ncbi:anion transporter, partial [archaeon]
MWRKIPPFVVALVVFILTLQVTMFDLPQRIALGILGIAVILWVTEVIPLYVTSFIILLLTTTV